MPPGLDIESCRPLHGGHQLFLQSLRAENNKCSCNGSNYLGPR